MTTTIIDRAVAPGVYSDGWNAFLDAVVDKAYPNADNPYPEADSDRVTWGAGWADAKTKHRKVYMDAYRVYRVYRLATERSWRKLSNDPMTGWHREDAPQSDTACCGLPIPEDAQRPAPDLLGDPFSTCEDCKR